MGASSFSKLFEIPTNQDYTSPLLMFEDKGFLMFLKIYFSTVSFLIVYGLFYSTYWSYPSKRKEIYRWFYFVSGEDMKSRKRPLQRTSAQTRNSTRKPLASPYEQARSPTYTPMLHNRRALELEMIELGNSDSNYIQERETSTKSKVPNVHQVFSPGHHRARSGLERYRQYVQVKHRRGADDGGGLSSNSSSGDEDDDEEVVQLEDELETNYTTEEVAVQHVVDSKDRTDASTKV